MNKKELITAIAAKSGLTKNDAGIALNAVTAAITEGLKAGERVSIPALGTFEIRVRAARKGKNPRTGETIKIPKKKVPAFKAAKALKDAVK